MVALSTMQEILLALLILNVHVHAKVYLIKTKNGKVHLVETTGLMKQKAEENIEFGPDYRLTSKSKWVGQPLFTL